MNTVCFYRKYQKKIKDIKIYCPKLIYEKNNKFFTNYILEDYLFCFHENFNDKKIYSKLKYLKGLSSILDGCSLNQDQIIEFINLCKENEQILFLVKITQTEVRGSQAPVKIKITRVKKIQAKSRASPRHPLG